MSGDSAINEILVINAGSSSIKFATFVFHEKLEKLNDGSIQNIHHRPILKIQDKDNNIFAEKRYSKPHDYKYFYELLFNHITSSGNKIDAVGHRVVHGGTRYHLPEIVTPPLLDYLKTLIPFAPLHQPFNIEAIEILQKSHPEVTQVVCFDTAFHNTHPYLADCFGIPRAYTEAGIKRYGFHGLSYEYIMYKLEEIAPEKAKQRIVVAHLGNGASMCAIKEGKSIDSTMGFTALDGLIMGTRCGSIDPGVLLFLMKYKNMSHDDIENLLYKESGLLGVSQLSSDMQILLQSDKEAAKEAIDLYVYRIRRELGALVSVLGGIDMLVFTGGIGENAPYIREGVCHNMDWLGIKMDLDKNKKNLSLVSHPNSSVQVRVIPTNEEWVIAHHTVGISY